LYNAIYYKKVLQIQYQPFESDTPFDFTIHPHYLKQYNNRWFLFGLNNENEKDVMDYYFNGITRKIEKQDLSFVYEKIWAKIDKLLPDKVKKVILSPDGMYNSVNVSTLFDINNNKYIFDKYEIVIADKIGAENNDDLSKLSSSINSAVLVGFPNYSGTTISDKQNTNDTLKLNLDKYYSNVTRGSIAKSLPGTKTEIEKINSMFVNNGIKTTVLMGNNATEDNLKKVVSPDVLHIATHGFFINSKEGTPMLNSVLLMAGSNNKTKKNEDGYLSAYETSLLNLDSTKLVVLSACETGRGVLKDGDGVFGLKQGCFNAGAQNIIMSLWKVDDKVTQEFMSRFYEIWLNDKTSIREAFNRTQLEIKANYPQPYYWGAFILVGE
jgi:CHAT domain-containing protein